MTSDSGGFGFLLLRSPLRAGQRNEKQKDRYKQKESLVHCRVWDHDGTSFGMSLEEIIRFTLRKRTLCVCQKSRAIRQEYVTPKPMFA